MANEENQTEVKKAPKGSILESVKNALGVGMDYDPFDAELIMHINSVFSTLHQLGVGPKTPFTITDSSDIWSSFLGDNKAIESVKTYVYLKVRLIFDPPATSYSIQSFEKICQELEWRLNVEVESYKSEKDDITPTPDPDPTFTIYLTQENRIPISEDVGYAYQDIDMPNSYLRFTRKDDFVYLDVELDIPSEVQSSSNWYTYAINPLKIPLGFGFPERTDFSVSWDSYNKVFELYGNVKLHNAELSQEVYSTSLAIETQPLEEYDHLTYFSINGFISKLSATYVYINNEPYPTDEGETT